MIFYIISLICLCNLGSLWKKEWDWDSRFGDQQDDRGLLFTAGPFSGDFYNPCTYICNPCVACHTYLFYFAFRLWSFWRCSWAGSVTVRAQEPGPAQEQPPAPAWITYTSQGAALKWLGAIIFAFLLCHLISLDWDNCKLNTCTLVWKRIRLRINLSWPHGPPQTLAPPLSALTSPPPPLPCASPSHHGASSPAPVQASPSSLARLSTW